MSTCDNLPQFYVCYVLIFIKTWWWPRYIETYLQTVQINKENHQAILVT